MSEFTVSTRYAISLLESSEMKNTLSKVSEDAEFVYGTFLDSKDLRNVIKSPIVKPNQKKLILEDLFKTQISDETFNFVLFVLQKGRENLITRIFERFLQLRDEKLGIVNAKVTSSINLSEQQKTVIKEKLEKYADKRVNLSYELSDEIIGGFIVRIGDTILDASLKHQLEKLKEKFITGSVLLN